MSYPPDRRRKYTAEERAFIEANYATMSRVEIGLALDRPEMSIKLFVQRNRISKGRKSDSQFRKGFTPWNKGRKGFAPAGSEKGHFPKGNLPHNATDYYDGMVVVREKTGEPPYKYRRLRMGKWQLSHRYNWEQAHGPIPKSHCLKCRTADTLNDSPDNWELLPRRELATRNGIWGQQRAATNLTDNYLAGTLTKGRRELREAVLANPDLLQVQRLKLTLNRTLKDGTLHASPQPSSK